MTDVFLLKLCLRDVVIIYFVLLMNIYFLSFLLKINNQIIKKLVSFGILKGRSKIVTIQLFKKFL